MHTIKNRTTDITFFLSECNDKVAKTSLGIYTHCLQVKRFFYFTISDLENIIKKNNIFDERSEISFKLNDIHSKLCLLYENNVLIIDIIDFDLNIKMNYFIPQYCIKNKIKKIEEELSLFIYQN